MTGFVYIMASRQDGAIYTGVTSDLRKRVHEHQQGEFDGFTKKYNCKQLVWYERHDEISQAIKREKAIKHWIRKWKTELIEKDNPEWRDLSGEIGW